MKDYSIQQGKYAIIEQHNMYAIVLVNKRTEDEVVPKKDILSLSKDLPYLQRQLDGWLKQEEKALTKQDEIEVQRWRAKLMKERLGTK